MDTNMAFPRMPSGHGYRDIPAGAGCTILRGKTGSDSTLDFALSVADGLSASPRRLNCRFLYDAKGSALFDLITNQPEYYLTRTEAGILAANAARIRDIAGPVTLVELGSGNSHKTDYLLRAWLARAQSACYIPVDVSEAALQTACRSISATHPAVRVIGLHADYQGAFPLLREVSPAMAIFLGSTIGNFNYGEMAAFLKTMSSTLSPGDFFLIGVDLVKDPAVIEAAYNDAAGVTSQFTRNLFVRMNRELGSHIDISAVEHVARYNPVKAQVEIGARFTSAQTIHVAPLGRSFRIEEGELVRTEVSRKFRLAEFIPFLEGTGFDTREVFTDERNWFALLLLRCSPLLPKAKAGIS